MDEFQLAPIPSAGPMKDAAGFCRPLATISKVGIELDFGNAKHAVVMSDCLRLQQVHTFLFVSQIVKPFPFMFYLTYSFSLCRLPGSYQSHIQWHQICFGRKLYSNQLADQHSFRGQKTDENCRRDGLVSEQKGCRQRSSGFDNGCFRVSELLQAMVFWKGTDR